MVQPLFYLNKIAKGKIPAMKYYYRSAPEIALNNNSMAAVDSIIDYVVKY